MSHLITFGNDENQRELLTVLNLELGGRYDYLELKSYLDAIISSTAESPARRNAAIELNTDLAEDVEGWNRRMQPTASALKAEYGRNVIFSANNDAHVTSLTVPPYDHI